MQSNLSETNVDQQASSAALPNGQCVHCGLPVPAGMIDESRTEQFCCNGCRTVYEVIHGSGLDRFYKLRDAVGAEGEPARTTDRRYAEFDDTVFRDLYVRSRPDDTQFVELYLEGVHCAACVWLVEKLPRVVPGVVEVRLNIRRSLVRIRWDDEHVRLSRIARTLDSLGYPPHPAKDARAREVRRQEDHRFLIRIGVAAACAGNVMVLAFALYGGVFTGIETQYSQLFRWASMVCGVIALVWPGSLFFRGAWAALRTRTAHLDLPIALALAAGGLAGAVNAVRGAGEIYYDSLTMLVFLLLVGRWVQRRQQRWAADSIELMFSITPTSARRIEGDEICEVPLEAIAPGDVVEVRAGDSVPADGTVASGQSTVDQSLLTGESRPVEITPGERVHAGTVNLAARLKIRVDAVGETTRVGRLMQLVEECSQRRAPIVQLADRIAAWFVLIVVTLAAATLVLWLWLDPGQAVGHATALLIVTCPCALGLATPLAVTVALGRAAGRRILIKGGDTLELLARPGMIVLDKTGTITAGKTSVTEFHGDERVKPLVAALESHSAHPVATALVAAFGPEEKSSRDADTALADVCETPGSGVAGLVDGHRVIVGSSRYVRSSGVEIPPDMDAAETAVVDKGATAILVAMDGRCVAVIGLADPIRDDVPEALDGLKRLGWDLRILSGDHPQVVAHVAKRLQIPEEFVAGGYTPEQKAEFFECVSVDSRVVMVGDGVNDAAALSAATVGIAVHGGAEASLAAADVYLSRPGLAPIVELMHAARNTLRTIHRSLAVSLAYNTVAAALAMAGYISPLVAAILMPISSFTVLALAYVSPTFRGHC